MTLARTSASHLDGHFSIALFSIGLLQGHDFVYSELFKYVQLFLLASLADSSTKLSMFVIELEFAWDLVLHLLPAFFRVFIQICCLDPSDAVAVDELGNLVVATTSLPRYQTPTVVCEPRVLDSDGSSIAFLLTVSVEQIKSPVQERKYLRKDHQEVQLHVLSGHQNP